MGTGVFLSGSNDSAVNLAMEESLLSSVGPGEKILFLYENNPAVVIGRFQNPWLECRTGLLERNGSALRRRISGGGTVVHGPGNLNISFISGLRIPEKEKNLNLVIRALSRIGLIVEMNSRYDMVIEKQVLEKDGERENCLFKVSGSAFRQTSSRSIHHATLLVDADLEKLGLFLHGPKRKIETRSVPSNPSPVANLSDLSPGLTVPAVAAALAGEWGSPVDLPRLDPVDFEEISGYREAWKRHLSESWIWGKTPDFDEQILLSSGPDEFRFRIHVSKGRISDIRCTAEGGNNSENKDVPVPSILLGCAYRGPDILAVFPGPAPDWLKNLAAAVDGDYRFPGN